MNKKILVRIILILTSFIIMLLVPDSNFYLKNGCVYLFLLILLILVLKPCKYLKVKKINKSIISYLIGILIGLILIVSVIYVLLLLNKIELIKNNYSLYVIAFMGAFWIIQSFFEEYLMRGVLYENIGKLLGYDLTIILTSLLFTLFHINNNSISFLSLVNIFLFGLLCGYLVKIYKNLYLVSGIHFIWNFLQGNIFGIEVSGNDAKDSFFTTITAQNQELYHGGDFGIEGGIITFIVLLISLIIVGFLSYIKYRSNEQIEKKTYYLYKSIDGFYLVGEDYIECIEINKEAYKTRDLLAIDCLKNTSLILLDNILSETNKTLEFDLGMIKITYFDKLELIDILSQKKGHYKFINCKYVLLKSLEFSLDK